MVELLEAGQRDELLNEEVFTNLTETKIIFEQWRREYNEVRPHSALGYRPPAPEAKLSLTLTYEVVSFVGADQVRLTPRLILKRNNLK